VYSISAKLKSESSQGYKISEENYYPFTLHFPGAAFIERCCSFGEYVDEDYVFLDRFQLLYLDVLHGGEIWIK